MKLKDVKKCDEVMALAIKNLTGNEFKVFYAWFTDKDGWNANAKVIAKRTDICLKQVRRLLISLCEKGFLRIEREELVHTSEGCLKRRIYGLGPAAHGEVKPKKLKKKKEAKAPKVPMGSPQNMPVGSPQNDPLNLLRKPLKVTSYPASKAKAFETGSDEKLSPSGKKEELPSEEEFKAELARMGL